jgi:hypothetical protein
VVFRSPAYERRNARKLAKPKTANKRKKRIMKKTKSLIAALAGLALFSLAGTAQAQYKPTGDDGITASPKARQFLDERKRVSAATSTAVDDKTMACPKCRDEYVKRTDTTAKGVIKPTIWLANHLCGGCDTTISVQGFGKAKHDVATHTCTSCGAENLACCNATKGSDVDTKGMEKKFQVAPLK